MIPEDKRVEIRRLFYGEHWKVGTIANQLGFHEDTVSRAIQLDRHASRGVAKPSALVPTSQPVGYGQPSPRAP